MVYALLTEICQRRFDRLVTDAIADYLLTPSPDGDDNLRNEGVSEKRIVRVGLL